LRTKTPEIIRPESAIGAVKRPARTVTFRNELSVRSKRSWPPQPCCRSSRRPVVSTVQVNRSGVLAVANLLRRAVPRRSRPALDGHDDAAADAQFGTHEFSITQETVTHHGQGRPKVLIVVAGEIHVVNDEDAATAKCGHGPAQLEDLPAGRVREDQVKLTQAADDLGPVT
jgi:hypothetical protein